MSPRLLIKLEKDTFSKNVFDENDPTFVLKGKLLFTPSSPMKVQSINLCFRGKYFMNKGFQSSRKIILNHKWDFLRNYKSVQFEAKEYAYDFEFPLPADIPESVDADYATIQYSLKATVETPFFGSNLRVDKVVYIRQKADNFALVLYNTHIENTWKEMVDYEVIIPSHEYTPGNTIPITFKYRVRDNFCKPISVWAGLDESATYRSTDENMAESVHNVTKWLRNSSGRISEGSSLTVLQLEVPKSTKNIHYNCTTAYIELRHHIHTRIEVRIDGLIKSIRGVLPICIVRELSNNTEVEAIDRPDVLPDYETVQDDCPPNYRNRLSCQSIPPYSVSIGV